MAAGTSNAAPVTENVTNNEGKVRCVCALRELYHFLYMICLESVYSDGIFLSEGT